jgi:hypothetical protein
MKRNCSAIMGFCFLLSFSLGMRAEPLVICTMIYTMGNDAGDTLDIQEKRITAKKREAQASIKDFTLRAKIMDVRPPGGPTRPVTGYNLSVTIANGKATSYMATNLTTGYQHYSTALIIGNETAYVNCDVE